MNDKFKKILGDAAGYVAVALVSALYVLSALIVPGVTGKSLGAIFIDGALGFLLGVSINVLMSSQGVMKGCRSEEFMATKKCHADIVMRLSPYLHLLDPWCEEQNRVTLENARKCILASAGLSYRICFDEEGRYLAPVLAYPAGGGKQRRLIKKGVRRQRRALRRARRLKLTRLCSATLTGDNARADDPYDFGITPDRYLRTVGVKSFISRLCCSIALGYFGVSMVTDFNYADLLWRGIYVAFMIAWGVRAMNSATMFVVTNYRGGVVRKINYLQMFENEKGKAENEQYGVYTRGLQDECREGADCKEEPCETGSKYLL